jgi:hypothetical protein
MIGDTVGPGPRGVRGLRLPRIATSRFRVHSVQVDGAATHAIVIGVSHYPHLNAGGGRPSLAREGMGQLSSPSVSARALATWLIQNLNDPSKPLGSVSLLLSEKRMRPFEHPASRSRINVQRATISTIGAALAEWKSAGDEDEDHRLLFYFCGHGIAQGTDIALLMADFGADQNDALRGALDFVRFRAGMDACAARQQVYFVDACRASSDTLIGAMGRAGDPVIAPNPNAPRPSAPRLAPVYYSTLAGQNAFGRAKKPSVFTDALLRSLAGAGADDTNGDWRVETTQLNRAIEAYMQRAIESGQRRAQVPATTELSRFDLHFLATAPVVPAIVQCWPPEDTKKARLGWAPEGQLPQVTRPPAARPWELELPFGTYDFSAEFPAAPPRSLTVAVRPVERRISLRADP